MKGISTQKNNYVKAVTQSLNAMSKLIAVLVIVLILGIAHGFAQAPNISYSSPQVYNPFIPITPLSPANSGGAIPVPTPVAQLSSSTAILCMTVDTAKSFYLGTSGSGVISRITGNVKVSLGTGFSNPSGLAVDPSGNVFVADNGHNAIKEILASNGTTNTLLSATAPKGMAIDAAGAIYFCVSTGVYKLASGATTRTTVATGFSTPVSVAVDAAGNVYVADPGASTITKVLASSGSKVVLATVDNALTGVGVDSYGNVYFSDTNSAIMVIPAAGGPILPVCSTLVSHKVIAVDKSANVYTDNGLAIDQVPFGYYSVSPALPAGLKLNAGTGIISNFPLQITAAANYTVTGYNSAGHSAAIVNIAVSAATKPNISYSTPKTYIVGASVSISPTNNTGGAVPTQEPFNIVSGLTANVNGLAVDAAGNIYAALQGATTITKYTTGGFSSTSIGSGFSNTTGVALDATGNVFVVDNGNKAIKEILKSDGSTVTYASGFSNPQGIAIDASGNLFVSDATAGAIYKIPSGGGTRVTLASGISTPEGVAVDPAGNVYYVVKGANTVRELPVGGGASFVLASGLNAPYGLAVDPGSNVFVADGGNKALKRIPAGGGAPVAIATAVGFLKPGAVALDASGNIYASDWTNQAIYEINPGYFINPTLPAGLSIDQSTGTISGAPTAVSPKSNYSVSTRNSGGVSVATIEITIAPLSSLAISYVSPDTYAVNTAIPPLAPNTNIVFDPNYLAVKGAIFASSLSTSRGIAADASGNLYVANWSNSKIIKISPSGTVSTLTTAIYQPNDIALDAAGNLYVAGYSGIYKISPDGTVTTLGPFGFRQPQHICIDGKGNMYVLDLGSPNVYEIAAGSTTAVQGPPLFATDLKCDKEGNWFAIVSQGYLYEVPASDRTQKIPLTGDVENRTGLAIDQGGNIYYTVGQGLNGVYQLTPGSPATKIYANVQSNSDYVAVDGFGNLFIYLNGGIIIKGIRQTGFFINNALPLGLSFNGQTGAISGTPTATSPATNYTVTGYNAAGSTAGTFNLAVVGAANTSLTNLAVSSGTLSPSFTTATTAYTVSVPYATSSITVTPTAGGGTASILVNGVAVSSGTASAAIPLNVGANNIYISVTDGGGTTVSNYSITATRSGSAVLASFTVSPGTISPAFSGSTYSYSTTLPAGASTITITPTAVDNTATITINGKQLASGTTSPNIQLAVGSNTITTVVTTADGTASQTYTLTATRPSANAFLSALHLSSGTLSPAFVSSTFSYTASVGNTVSSVTATPTTLDGGATVKVNGTAVTSGTASGPISLAVGTNTITVVVTAADGATTKTYTVTVTRAASGNASLSAFRISRGTLTPAFTSATTGYTASVVNGVTSMTVTPTAAASSATITVNGTAVVSGTASGALSLAIGSNTITTIVTAPDGTTTKTYTLTVTRAAGPINIPDESIAVAAPIEKPSIEDDVIIVHQGISPNGDGINDFLVIDGIQAYPDNKLTIINRSGALVFEAKGYDNASRVFDGRSNKTGQMQLPGTYFYSLDYTANGIVKHKTGFLVLKY